MDKRRLQIWQPITCLAKGNIVFAKFEYSNKLDRYGLRLELTDSEGNEVEIIYDKLSEKMGDYVWTYRYVNEFKTNLNELVESADSASLIDPSFHHFYKMENSDFIEWYDQLPWLGSQDEPSVEHHIYMYNDGIFEVVSDYEPRFLVKKSTKKG